VWERAQERRADDPDGAIALARTLLQTVCKHILDARAVAYEDGDELPRLTRLTAEALRIAPSDATEDAFRRIFGACTSIVESLGTIRNRMGDAHGRGADATRVAPRYARLAVNLSGAIARNEY
jgi:abortive infection Abi-like protein